MMSLIPAAPRSRQAPVEALWSPPLVVMNAESPQLWLR